MGADGAPVEQEVPSLQVTSPGQGHFADIGSPLNIVWHVDDDLGTNCMRISLVQEDSPGRTLVLNQQYLDTRQDTRPPCSSLLFTCGPEVTDQSGAMKKGVTGIPGDLCQSALGLRDVRSELREKLGPRGLKDRRSWYRGAPL